jgi:hypothetical protein
MNVHPASPIDEAEVDAFCRVGAACMRGLFDADWVEHMRAAVEDDLAHPGPLAREYAKQGGRLLGQAAISVTPPTVRPGEPLDSAVFPRLWPR